MIPETFTEVGVRLDLLVTGWLGLGLIVLAIAAFVIGEFVLKAYDGHVLIGSLLFLFGAISLLIWLILLWPFRSEYHHVYRVQSHVEDVSNVLTEASGDLTRTPVLTLDNIDRPVVMDDPRAVELEGRDVTLTCRIGWHYQAADTYSCEIYAIGEAKP